MEVSLRINPHQERNKEKLKVPKEKAMMMKKMIVVVLIFCIFSSQMGNVEPQGVDCYDACSTGCVQSNTRLMQRCDRKCQIKCGPDSKVEGNLG
ncbi:hypothetical protein CRYUN_Cryun10bG0153600 [Craigia yunnanensis]